MEANITPVVPPENLSTDNYKYGWHDEIKEHFKSGRGLSEDVVRNISKIKEEPEWMLNYRLKALRHFNNRPLPIWGGDLSEINFDNIFYYLKPIMEQSTTMGGLPPEIKRTYDKLGISEAEQKFLGGSSFQYESDVVYHTIREDLAKQGVIFTDCDSGLREYPEIFKKYFGTIIPANDNKFSALNSAVWSGGSFVHVPKGVKVDIPLQAYFRINAENMGQFERTLIIAEEGSFVHYVEGCHIVGSLVLTELGEIPIEALTIKDKVLTHKGRLRSIEKIIKRPFVGELYHIATDGFSSNLNVTPEHPFYVLSNNSFTNTPSWIEAKTLKVGDKLLIPNISEIPIPNRQKVLVTSWAEEIRTPLEKLHTTEFREVEITGVTKTFVSCNVFNLKVKEDESYLCEGVISHNCTAPIYTSDSLHSAVVELIAMEGSRIRYTTIQNWSNNVYNLVTKRAYAHKNSTVEWVDGNIGCIAEGSRISTPLGQKTIESLKPGDEVLSYDETKQELCFKKVVAVKASGKQAIYKVREGSKELLVTANHPFFSYLYDSNQPKKLGRYNLGYVRADHLISAIIPKTSIPYGQSYDLNFPLQKIKTEFISKNQYSKQFTATHIRTSQLKEIKRTNTDLAWLFGLFTGDGNITKKKAVTPGLIRYASVGFSVPHNDRAREKLLHVMEGIFKKPPTERKDRVHLYYNSVELAQFFESNDFKTGAKIKRIPSWIYDLPEEERLAFIAGYLDSDGTVILSKKRLSIKSCNKILLSQTADILHTLGIFSNLYTEHDEPRTTLFGERTGISTASHRLDFLPDKRLTPYLSTESAKKLALITVPINQYYRKIGRSQIILPDNLEIKKVKVEQVDNLHLPTWDIEVEDTGNFVCEGFIVHNSKLTMKYPSVYLMGEGAKGDVLSIAFAGPGQHQDAGAKMIHAAPNTTSTVVSKSISKGGGRTSYRGLVKVYPGMKGSKASVRCDALLMDEDSRSDTYPYMQIDEDQVQIGHEATVSKIGDEQLFYLQSRGISEEEAMAMIVNGFIEPFTKELPMEYAVELNRLIQLQMEGSVG
jgi:Fe-S cluster assembly scaffold protein SufB